MNATTIVIALISLVGGGSFLRLLQWFTDRQKTVADGWHGYSKDLELRMTKLEANYEKKIRELENLLVAKNKEILDLQTKVTEQSEEIRNLRHQVRDMQQYQHVQGEVKQAEAEQAKAELHQAVEVNIDKLTPTIP